MFRTVIQSAARRFGGRLPATHQLASQRAVSTSSSQLLRSVRPNSVRPCASPFAAFQPTFASRSYSTEVAHTTGDSDIANFINDEKVLLASEMEGASRKDMQADLEAFLEASNFGVNIQDDGEILFTKTIGKEQVIVRVLKDECNQFADDDEKYDFDEADDVVHDVVDADEADDDDDDELYEHRFSVIFTKPEVGSMIYECTACDKEVEIDKILLDGNIDDDDVPVYPQDMSVLDDKGYELFAKRLRGVGIDNNFGDVIDLVLELHEDDVYGKWLEQAEKYIKA
eukprot:TRINITY_DN8651_c0_g1_i1.p1 TRINITY_DN8651_c0_g1~~TRINITY_DN8651_c0_g1_i1.p1  ORF type:complete len:300 (-),score=108.00 TRINITY_DN8651_c0_g1_i1:195-1046(-)